MSSRRRIRDLLEPDDGHRSAPRRRQEGRRHRVRGRLARADGAGATRGARRLVAAGEVEITQRGRVVGPLDGQGADPDPPRLTAPVRRDPARASACYRRVPVGQQLRYSRYMNASGPDRARPARPRDRPERVVRPGPAAGAPPDRSAARHQRRDASARSRRSTASRSATSRSPPTADVDAAFKRARRAQAAWARTSLEERVGADAPPARPRAGAPGRDHRPHLLGVGQGAQARLRRAAAHRADRPLLRAHGARAPGLAPRRRRRPRTDPRRGQPRPQGRRRHHLAVELPLHHGAVRRAAGDHGRQRGRGQARRPDHAERPLRPRAAARRRLPRGPLADGRRPGPRDRHRRSSSAPTTSASPARPRPAR